MQLSENKLNIKGSETVEIYAETEKKNVFDLRVIIESYEGLAIMTTMNSESTLIKFSCLKCNFDDCLKLLESLEKDGLLLIKNHNGV